MALERLPSILANLHEGEEFVRRRSIEALAEDQLGLHIDVIKQAMNLADSFRKYETDDEDTKLVQVLGMRTFNAFGASLKLCLSGYYQNAVLILRDVLETVFLIDLFGGDRKLIAQWRLADKSTRLKNFRPVRVRTLLDDRDGCTERKRAAMYDMFSEFAGHASMQGIAMLRPRGMDAKIGPFFDVTTLEAVLSEMGRLAVQVGEQLNVFIPDEDGRRQTFRDAFDYSKGRWLAHFYS